MRLSGSVFTKYASFNSYHPRLQNYPGRLKKLPQKRSECISQHLCIDNICEFLMLKTDYLL
jgi:hypothetical protein